MRRYITKYLLWLTTAMVLIYGILMNVYFFKVIDNLDSLDLELTATYFERAYKANPSTPLPNDSVISSYLGFENLPEKYKKQFPREKFHHRKMLYYEDYLSKEDACDFIYLMSYNLYDGKQLFVIKTYREYYEEFTNIPNLKQMLSFSVFWGIVFILAFFFIVRYMLKKLYRPVSSLTRWAENMTPQTLANPVPDFTFQEVNLLAGLLHTSMKTLSDTLERDQRFIRNASHELRTPIAILQSNIELLDRISPDIQGPQKMPMDRIRRAVFNMSRLIETLLWMAKDDQCIPSLESVALDAMASEIVKENRYLLKEKMVEVHLSLKPSQVLVNPHAVRIAMGNLIRNAFQYTMNGRVEIEVENATIIVTNINQTDNEADEGGSEYGFGLGLILVEQLAERSGWQYKNDAIDGGRKATLVF